MKYRLFRVSELDMVQPKPTMIRHNKEAIVSTYGVMIYTNRLAEPIMVESVGFLGWC